MNMTRKNSGVFSTCYSAFFAPLIWILNLSAQGVLRGAGVPVESVHTFMNSRLHSGRRMLLLPTDSIG